MDINTLPSALLSNAVDEMSSLPGIGRKTALRLVLHLLRQPTEQVERFSRSFVSLRHDIKQCEKCCNISDTDLCPICSSTRRDKHTLCVVEGIRDVMSIEATMQYKGLYHVLGGIISPIDGIGPADLTIGRLLERIVQEDVKEVIIALSTTMEGETTGFYLYKKLSGHPITISTLARGMGVGDELEYTDEVTLGRSLVQRTPFAQNMGGSKESQQ